MFILKMSYTNFSSYLSDETIALFNFLIFYFSHFWNQKESLGSSKKVSMHGICSENISFFVCVCAALKMEQKQAEKVEL